MDHVHRSWICYLFIILLNTVIVTLAFCPPNCGTNQNCTDPDGGCPLCELGYWGRQCEYRTECQFIYRRSVQYTGMQNKTIDGTLCQDWSSQTPHAHSVSDVALTENYCRIVTSFNDRRFPWCFTTDPGIEWLYCGVKLCEFQCPAPPLKNFEVVIDPPSEGFELGHEIHISNGYGSSRHTCMSEWCWSGLTCLDSTIEDSVTTGVLNPCPLHCQRTECNDPDQGCLKCESPYWGRQCQYRTECMYGNNGISYRGLRNTTRFGRPCQHWSEQSPHKHPFSGTELTENHCRNPAGSTYRYYYPWCYTTDIDTSWDYCGIDYCYLQCSPPRLRYQQDVLNPPPYGFHIGYVVSLYDDRQSKITNHTCTPERCWSSLTCTNRCPAHCSRYQCNDPDGGCQRCLAPYWGRQCQHRMECKKDVYGITYRGRRNVTENEKPCLHWSATNLSIDYILGMELTENYCRNPDYSEGPWCFTTGQFADVKEFCDIESCYRHCSAPPLGSYDDVQNPPMEGFQLGYEIFLKNGETVTRHTCTTNRCWSDLTCKEAPETESSSIKSTESSTFASTIPSASDTTSTTSDTSSTTVDTTSITLDITSTTSDTTSTTSDTTSTTVDITSTTVDITSTTVDTTSTTSDTTSTTSDTTSTALDTTSTTLDTTSTALDTTSTALDTTSTALDTTSTTSDTSSTTLDTTSTTLDTTTTTSDSTSTTSDTTSTALDTTTTTSDTTSTTSDTTSTALDTTSTTLDTTSTTSDSTSTTSDTSSPTSDTTSTTSDTTSTALDTTSTALDTTSTTLDTTTTTLDTTTTTSDTTSTTLDTTSTTSDTTSTTSDTTSTISNTTSTTSDTTSTTSDTTSTTLDTTSTTLDTTSTTRSLTTTSTTQLSVTTGTTPTFWTTAASNTPSITSGATTESNSTTIQSTGATNTASCCVCVVMNWNNVSSEGNDAELMKWIKIRLAYLKQKLAVNRTTLSSYVRKKTSAVDDRPSVRYIGFGGIATIIAVVTSFISCDVLSFRRHSMICRRQKIKYWD